MFNGYLIMEQDNIKKKILEIEGTLILIAKKRAGLIP